MKNEIKVGDCFKEGKNVWHCVVRVNKNLTWSHQTWSVSNDHTATIFDKDGFSSDMLNTFKPITRAEFDAELQNAFDRIKAELPEVK